MALLTLTKLECIEKQDTINKDLIRVEVDGDKAAGDFRMDKEDVLTFTPGIQIPFTGTVPITLIELDNGADENLGTVTADAANPGRYTREFTDLPSYHYHLSYEIS